MRFIIASTLGLVAATAIASHIVPDGAQSLQLLAREPHTVPSDSNALSLVVRSNVDSHGEKASRLKARDPYACGMTGYPPCPKAKPTRCSNANFIDRASVSKIQARYACGMTGYPPCPKSHPLALNGCPALMKTASSKFKAREPDMEPSDSKDALGLVRRSKVDGHGEGKISQLETRSPTLDPEVSKLKAREPEMAPSSDSKNARGLVVRRNVDSHGEDKASRLKARDPRACGTGYPPCPKPKPTRCSNANFIDQASVSKIQARYACGMTGYPPCPKSHPLTLNGCPALMKTASSKFKARKPDMEPSDSKDALGLVRRSKVAGHGEGKILQLETRSPTLDPEVTKLKAREPEMAPSDSKNAHGLVVRSNVDSHGEGKASRLKARDPYACGPGYLPCPKRVPKLFGCPTPAKSLHLAILKARNPIECGPGGLPCPKTKPLDLSDECKMRFNLLESKISQRDVHPRSDGPHSNEVLGLAARSSVGSQD